MCLAGERVFQAKRPWGESMIVLLKGLQGGQGASVKESKGGEK